MRLGSFQWCPLTEIRGNGHKLAHRNFYVNIQKNFFTLRVMEHWNKLHREAVESPLEILKTHPNDFLCLYFRKPASAGDIHMPFPTPTILWSCKKKICIPWNVFKRIRNAGSALLWPPNVRLGARNKEGSGPGTILRVLASAIMDAPLIDWTATLMLDRTDWDGKDGERMFSTAT